MRHDHERIGAALEALLRAGVELDLRPDRQYAATIGGPDAPVQIRAEGAAGVVGGRARMAHARDPVGVLELAHTLEEIARKLTDEELPRP